MSAAARAAAFEQILRSAADAGAGHAEFWAAEPPGRPVAVETGDPLTPAPALVARRLRPEAAGEGGAAVAPVMVAPGPGVAFAEIAYGAVERGEPVFVPGEGSAAWTSAGEYLRGRVVFLDPFEEFPVSTPLGPAGSAEVLAHAATSLAAGTAVRLPATWLACALLLLIGMIVGHLGVGRSPLAAAWAWGLICSVSLLVGIALTAIGRYLIDPSMVVLTATLALVVATRLAFAEERRRRDHNRRLLERFVSAELVGKYVENPDMALGLAGQRTFVAVLFADARDFTSFTERNSPEAVVALMNRYLAAMTPALQMHGGILDKFTGDGLMAFFRAEGDHRDTVARCIAAALEMRARAQALSADLAGSGAATLGFGMGVHCGEAIVGLVGDPERQVNYTALGLAVNVAARLQGLAAAGEIVVSEDARRLADGLFAFDPREPVEVKGISGPVRPWSAGAAPGLPPAP